MKTEQQQTVTAEPRQRHAWVYVRQAVTPHFVVIDADIGHGAAAAGGRKGFERVVTEVATGRLGIVLSLGASRLARNLSDGQRLLDACARTDTLIGSAETPHKPQALRS